MAGTSVEALIALTVLAVVFVGLAREWGSPDVLALAGAATLLATGVLSTGELLRVFSNSGPITVGAMFVLSGALQATGVIESLGAGLRWILRGTLRRYSLVLLMLAVMIVSAFVNNTPVVVVLAPLVIGLAREFSQAPSRFLLPLSYASIFGGSCTLIGTSTNLLADGVASAHGLAPFGMFELTAPGLVLGFVGVSYLWLLGPHLLPERKSEADVLEEGSPKRFLSELIVTTASNLVGKTTSKLQGAATEVVEVVRGDRFLSPDRVAELRPGDRVIVRTSAAEAVHLRGKASSNAEEGDPQVRSSLVPAGFELVQEAETIIREGVVAPASHYEDRAVGSLNLRRLYDVRILAVHRQGGTIRHDFERARLQMGDVLLLEGPAEGLKRLFDTQELVSLREPALQRRRTERAPIALATTLGMVVLAALGMLPLVALAMIAAALVLVTGCLRPSEAYERIDWKILFLIFGMLAIGQGLETSGAVDLIDRALSSLVSGLHPWAVLAIVYLAASLFTELITNNVVAVVITPIAIGLAQQLGIDPRPFVVAVMFAGSASFATPLGYQTNTFVYGAGNYRFWDFVKVGAPLNVLMWIVATLVIPIFWPLTRS